MIVHDLVHREGEYAFTVEGPMGRHRIRLWGDVPDSPTLAIEPALAIALLPAMAADVPLHLPQPPTATLRRALPDIQAVLASLATASPLVDGSVHAVETNWPDGGGPGGESAHPSRGVAAFFSGGVDSWWTLQSDPAITDLIYVHGFDIPIDQRDVSEVVERQLLDATAGSSKRLHIVRSNLRDLLDPAISWEIAHGPALAAVALLFSPICSRVLIPATTTYEEPAPRGSHPLHDHLWSTEGCRVEHHGGYLTRVEKIEQIVKTQTALNVLRVCWRHVDRYNCGCCEKCLRTMATLAILGALDRCPTFPDAVDLDALRALRFHDPHLPIWWGENLRLAKAHRADPDLIAAIEACLGSNPPATENASGIAKRLVSAEHEREALKGELDAIRGSRSWRVTESLRRVGSFGRRLSRGRTI